MKVPENFESVIGYLKYDFNKDPKWRKYVEDLSPTPNPREMERLRKVFYRDTVDPKFDPTFEPPIPNQHDHSNCDGNHGHGGYSHEPPAPARKEGLLLRTGFHIENMFKFMFLSSTVFFRTQATYISVIVCVLALLRQLKFPRLKAEYLKRLLTNEFTHNLFYVATFIFYSDLRGLGSSLPLMVHFWVGISEYLNIQQNFMYRRLKDSVDKTRGIKPQLLLLKQKMELWMPVYFLFSILIWNLDPARTLIWIVIYVNYLRVKFVINDNLQTAAEQVNKSLERSFGKSKIGQFLLRSLRRLCTYLTTFENKKGKEQQPSKTPQKTPEQKATQ